MGDVIQNLFVTKKVNTQGIYTMRFFVDGEWKEITVDDYFPCHSGGDTVYAKAEGTKTEEAEVKEIWVTLLEKAFAKRFGSYGALNSGQACDALRELSGCPSKTLGWSPDELDDLWAQLSSFDGKNYAMCASVGDSDTLLDKRS